MRFILTVLEIYINLTVIKVYINLTVMEVYINLTVMEVCINLNAPAKDLNQSWAHILMSMRKNICFFSSHICYGHYYWFFQCGVCLRFTSKLCQHMLIVLAEMSSFMLASTIIIITWLSPMQIVSVSRRWADTFSRRS